MLTIQVKEESVQGLLSEKTVAECKKLPGQQSFRLSCQTNIALSEFEAASPTSPPNLPSCSIYVMPN